MRILFSKNTEIYHLDDEKANAALQNILVSCGKAPNTVPFDKLTIQPQSYKKSYNVLIILTGMILILTLLLPVFAIPISGHMSANHRPEPIMLVSDYVEDGIIYLHFTGDNMLLEDAYLETNDNRSEGIVFYDGTTKTIGFNYYEDTESNIYIPTADGGTSQFLITPDK